MEEEIWIWPGRQVLSMRDAVFIVSPNRLNFGSLDPMRPLHTTSIRSHFNRQTCMDTLNLPCCHLSQGPLLPDTGTAVDANADRDGAAIVGHTDLKPAEARVRTINLVCH